MEKAIKILEFLKFSEKLKTQKRSVQNSNKDYESSADHSWHLALMALLVEPHLEDKIDLLKTLKMILIHDLVEAEIGDLPYYDGISNPKLYERKNLEEKNEIEKIKDMISRIDENIATEIYDLWHEYKQRETKESLFAKALDSMEANFQSIILGNIDYWGDIDHEIFLTKADEYCEHEKILKNINLVIKQKMKAEIEKTKNNTTS